MPFPFGPDTWVKRSTTPTMTLNGVSSGIVSGPLTAVYDAPSRTVQAFSIPALHFLGFSNIACISFDDGGTWALSFNVDSNRELYQQAITGWSLPHPNIDGARIHFQFRSDWRRAFFVFDGSMPPGGLSLWASEGGATFFKIQDLNTWPAINEIGGSGGAAIFNTNPSVTPPVQIEGSGPNGEDAYWLITAYELEAGGASNRTTFKAVTLWRSLNGITWENIRDLESELGVVPNVIELIRSSTGRLILRSNLRFWYTDETDDLTTASWTQSSIAAGAGIGGNLLPMYGGTWFSFSQGTLTGPGGVGISCDDAESFIPGGASITPQNRTGYAAKLGPSEILAVAPGFSDPTTETCSYYSSDGGETFVASDPWITSTSGEQPVCIGIRSDGTPIVVCRGAGSVYVSSDRARGITSTRTVCPLASAGLASARRLALCGGVITPDCMEF